MRSQDSPAEPASKPDGEAAKSALSEFNSLIGGWRGVGQTQRNSTKDAWTETGEWAWKFDKNDKQAAALRYVVKNGKQLQSGELTYDAKAKRFTLQATFSGDVRRKYEGKLEGEKLVGILTDNDLIGALVKVIESHP